jgi:hypothetical protein
MLNSLLKYLPIFGEMPRDPTQAIPELSGLKKSSIRMHPFSVPKTSLGSSKIGGQFIDPGNSDVPACPEHRTDLINVLQVMGKDVEGWDSAAVLQVFWCPQDHADTYCPHLHIRWVKSSDTGIIERKPPAAAEEQYIPKPCTLRLESIIEYPSIFELSDELSARVGSIRKWARWGRKLFGSGYEDYSSYFYQNYLSTAPGWKIGGWCNWEQASVQFMCDRCNKKMEHLVTLGSQMYDGATRFRWGKHIGKKGYDKTDIMIGDCGSLYVHHCKSCSQYKWDSQGS